MGVKLLRRLRKVVSLSGKIQLFLANILFITEKVVKNKKEIKFIQISYRALPFLK